MYNIYTKKKKVPHNAATDQSRDLCKKNKKGKGSLNDGSKDILFLHITLTDSLQLLIYYALHLSLTGNVALKSFSNIYDPLSENTSI